MVQSSWGPRKAYLFVTALSLSVGWGIRGNFGHEYGAMLPGALAAMALVLLSGRSDWLGAVPFFAMFGALGWSFGGSMSYMQVIGYTHSGHSPSVLYGFANLFVIGFLWAALGGMGTALPGRRRSPAAGRTLLAAGACPAFLVAAGRCHRAGSAARGIELDWYDTDWLAALLALVAASLLALLRRRIDRGTSLVLHLSFGWWLGFGLLVLLLGLRMTPPRRRQLGRLPGDGGRRDRLLSRERPGRGRTSRACVRVHRRDRVCRGVDAQAGRGHQRVPDQLAQHPRTVDGLLQWNWHRCGDGGAGQPGRSGG